MNDNEAAAAQHFAFFKRLAVDTLAKVRATDDDERAFVAIVEALVAVHARAANDILDMVDRTCARRDEVAVAAAALEPAKGGTA